MSGIRSIAITFIGVVGFALASLAFGKFAVGPGGVLSDPKVERACSAAAHTMATTKDITYLTRAIFEIRELNCRLSLPDTLAGVE